MTEEKKTVARKTAPKKVVTTKAKEAAIETETVEKGETKPIEPKREKRIEIDRNEMVPCRSTVHGDLIYKSYRTRAKYIWEEFGATLYLEMGELQDMNGSQRKYLHDGYIIVDDTEAAEYLGLTKVYDQIAHIDSLEELFAKSAEDLLVILPKLPVGMKNNIATKARELIEDGSLDSLGKIRAVESVLKVDLESFATKK